MKGTTVNIWTPQIILRMEIRKKWTDNNEKYRRGYLKCPHQYIETQIQIHFLLNCKLLQGMQKLQKLPEWETITLTLLESWMLWDTGSVHLGNYNNGIIINRTGGTPDDFILTQ